MIKEWKRDGEMIRDESWWERMMDDGGNNKRDNIEQKDDRKMI